MIKAKLIRDIDAAKGKGQVNNDDQIGFGILLARMDVFIRFFEGTL